MARWEYLTIDLANLPARTDDIDGSTKSDQVWELIAVINNRVACLRPPIDYPALVPEQRSSVRRRKNALASNK